jgi:hypothetical protein
MAPEPTRDQLNAEARAAGVQDPESLPNRQAVADAITQAHAQRAAAAGNGGQDTGNASAGAGDVQSTPDPAAIPGGGDTSASTAAPPAEAQARTDVPVSMPVQAPQPVVEETKAEGGFVSALPNLTPGDAGPLVMELACKLYEHGFDNAVARGEAAPILTDVLMDRVREFQAERGHDPRKPLGGGEVSPFRTRAEGVVDAHTWALLFGGPVTLDRAQTARAGGSR